MSRSDTPAAVRVEPSVRPLRAAVRDASWYRNPSTHGKDLVYHAQRSEVHHSEGACGVPIIGREGYPARDVTVEAATVAPQNRCQRPGCRARWPKWPNASLEAETPNV